MVNTSTPPGPDATRRAVHRRAALVVVALLATLGLLAGCGSDSSSSSAPTTTQAPSTSTSTSTVTGTVTVFAAASLKEAFTEVAASFKAANPGADVALNFGASSALAQQINEKAPADVFASADQANMQKVVDAGGISGTPQVFATNSLEIIVAPGNPKGITGVDDLSKSGLIYVTCGPDVPIGKYAAQVFDKAGVTAPTPASLEADVKAVVTKVTSGEADAGMVYATDVTAAGAKAEGVEIPTAVNVVATYPLGVTTEAANPAGAAAWAAFITGSEGQAILAKYGFGPA
jgi:molybdate transport system substrate-binding protein